MILVNLTCLVILIAVSSPFVKIDLPLILIFTIIHLNKKKAHYWFPHEVSTVFKEKIENKWDFSGATTLYSAPFHPLSSLSLAFDNCQKIPTKTDSSADILPLKLIVSTQP